MRRVKERKRMARLVFGMNKSLDDDRPEWNAEEHAFAGVAEPFLAGNRLQCLRSDWMILSFGVRRVTVQ